MGTTIGLDIGSSAVRAAQIKTGRGIPTLERIGQVLLPPGAVRDGEIQDPDVVADAIRTLWSERKLSGRKAALGVANQQVVVRQMDLPYLPDDELRESLPFQVADAIPIPVDQAVLDFHTLEHFESDNGEKFSRVLLVAAQREMVDRILEVADKAKIEPVLLDLDAFAVLRCLAPERVVDDEGGELLLDIGSSVTNIVVHENGLPRFVRILLMGGRIITDSLVGALGMEPEEAEHAKALHGIDGDPDNEAAKIIGERATRFVDEIRGSVDYYTAQADSVPLRRLVVTGGAGKLPGLAERLADQLRLELVEAQPMRDVQVGDLNVEREDLVEAQPFLAVAIGLALGAAE